MTTDTAIPQTYDEAVRTLARWHGEDESPPVAIFSFDDPEGMVVRLVEVSADFLAKDQLWVVRFGASEEFPFDSAVALATPEEWEQIGQGGRALPDGWRFGEATQVWPE
jgi:hypothetical protein